MKLKYIILLITFLTGGVYACDNNKVNDFIVKDHGHVVQVLNSDRMLFGSSIFFHYLSDKDEHPDVNASFAPDRCNPQKILRSILFPMMEVPQTSNLFSGGKAVTRVIYS
jgi:hypothetical protein